MNQALGKFFATLYVVSAAGAKKIKNSERGQGTLEYVGMIAVAAVIIVAVIGVLNKADIGAWVQKAIDSVKTATGN